MPILPGARTGEHLKVMDRELEFSFHMMRRGNRRWGVHTMLYAAEPWAVIAGSVADQVTNAAERQAAQSFVRQAREYFTAAERASTVETRPLLYYYAFLNLAKALAMSRSRSGLVGKVAHGVALDGRPGTGHTVSTARLQWGRTSPTQASAVDELHWALEGRTVPTVISPISEIIPQSVVAHRMWREAALRRERFIAVKTLRLNQDKATQTLWATIQVGRDTLRSRGLSVADTLAESQLGRTFRAVADHAGDVLDLRTFEQTTPLRYNDRPSDVVMDLVTELRPVLWQTVTSAPPYRRFYLYLSPPGEQRHPQWLSIYATLFWLGSLTRYQPVELLELLEGPYGPFFREFIATQPSQLLYILASEFKRQDVARAAVV